MLAQRSTVKYDDRHEKKSVVPAATADPILSALADDDRNEGRCRSCAVAGGSESTAKAYSFQAKIQARRLPLAAISGRLPAGEYPPFTKALKSCIAVDHCPPPHIPRRNLVD